MIQSFKCKDTQALYEGKSPRRFSAFLSVTERNGQHSLRITDPWRMCFIWSGLGPVDVEIVDYR
jgi:proteic killer suppression protein